MFHLANRGVDDENAGIVRFRIGRKYEEANFLRIVGLGRSRDLLVVAKRDFQLAAMHARADLLRIVAFAVSAEIPYEKDCLDFS